MNVSSRCWSPFHANECVFSRNEQQVFENPRRGRQARNFATNVPENSRSQFVFRTDLLRKLTLGAPVECLSAVMYSIVNSCLEMFSSQIIF